MPLSASVEPLTPCLAEWAALHASQYAEMDSGREPLAVAYDTYAALDALGRLCFATLRDDGRLVGYSLCFVQPSLHFASTPAAIMDAIWIEPAYRARLGSLRLLRATKRDLEARGVRRWLVSELLAHPIGRLFTALGFHPVETVYETWLG